MLWQGESESFLNFAEKYDVHKMKDAIEPALKRLLNAQNAFRFLGLAYQFELIELKALAAAVVQSDFMSPEMSANMKVSKNLNAYQSSADEDRANIQKSCYLSTLCFAY